VLSSGATSNYYIDVRKTSLHPEGLKLISRLFYEMIENDKRHRRRRPDARTPTLVAA